MEEYSLLFKMSNFPAAAPATVPAACRLPPPLHHGTVSPNKLSLL
ncbi:rCG38027, isoform CRA_b [Rattus norvegicus]|uniref:RCG38027, isoform CRA_b n=1 Tax=Rattus norvegicus TaxID=10116 RepID=A6IUZ6_RAT|nr:rCG38027, isoform CRA_b [Rattus norvegicus]EDM07185.1 rCG38027, isoform CRA_b [Rattus norvegicus]